MSDRKQLESPLPRFIDPKATPEMQYDQLRSLIAAPPQGSRILDVTPALAGLVLERLNSLNRKKRPSNIKRFAQAMSGDNWIVTGDSLKFSRKSGTLLDGQNRLAACVRSGKSFRTHIVFGVEDDAFSRIDAGANRTNADVFKIAGITHYSVTAPAVRWLIIMSEAEAGKLPDRGRKVDNQELLDFYNNSAAVDTKRLERAAADASKIGRVLPTGLLAAHLYVFASKNDRAALRFAEDLREHKAGGRVLLRKIDRLRKAHMGRLNELLIGALIIQAWNVYRSNRKLAAPMLEWDEAKPYPVIA